MPKRAKAKPAPAKVDLNSVSMVQLLEVKGIGTSRAEEIVRYRGRHGPFASLDDLAHVPHVGDMPPEELDKVKAQLRVTSEDTPSIAPGQDKVDVNQANVEELRTIEGIGHDRAEEIIHYREEQGGIRDLNELDALPHFKDEPEGQRAPIKARLKV
jgi:competence protein ComEA